MAGGAVGAIDVENDIVVRPSSASNLISGEYVNGYNHPTEVLDGDAYNLSVNLYAMNGYRLCTVNIIKNSSVEPVKYSITQGKYQIRIGGKCELSEDSHGAHLTIENL